MLQRRTRQQLEAFLPRPPYDKARDFASRTFQSTTYRGWIPQSNSPRNLQAVDKFGVPDGI